MSYCCACGNILLANSLIKGLVKGPKISVFGPNDKCGKRGHLSVDCSSQDTDKISSKNKDKDTSKKGKQEENSSDNDSTKNPNQASVAQATNRFVGALLVYGRFSLTCFSQREARERERG